MKNQKKPTAERLIEKKQEQVRPVVIGLCIIMITGAIILYCMLAFLFDQGEPASNEKSSPAVSETQASSVVPPVAVLKTPSSGAKTGSVRLSLELDLNSLAKVPVRTNVNSPVSVK